MANEVLRITFLSVIQENLLRNADFLKKSVNHDSYVKDSSVEIPQAGEVADVLVDNGSYTVPLPITPRIDDKKTYDLYNFRIPPTFIPDSNELETSYDKAQSILKNHVDKLNQDIGDYGAFEWAVDPTYTPASAVTGRILRTTGTATTKALLPGMTGSRKSLLIDDLAQARAKLGEDNVPETDGFYCLMPSRIYWDFVNANKDVLDNDYMNRGNLPEGIVAKVHGWNILTRGETCRYNVGATAKKAIGSAYAADDNGAILCWHENYVARALGASKVYSEADKPEYQGSIYSSWTRFNNIILRNDLKGVVTIVQTA